MLELSDYGSCPYYVVYSRITSLRHPTPTALPAYYQESPSIAEYNQEIVKEVGLVDMNINIKIFI